MNLNSKSFLDTKRPTPTHLPYSFIQNNFFKIIEILFFLTFQFLHQHRNHKIHSDSGFRSLWLVPWCICVSWPWCWNLSLHRWNPGRNWFSQLCEQHWSCSGRCDAGENQHGIRSQVCWGHCGWTLLLEPWFEHGSSCTTLQFVLNIFPNIWNWTIINPWSCFVTFMG